MNKNRNDVLYVLKTCLDPASLEKLKNGLKERIENFKKEEKLTSEQRKERNLNEAYNAYLSGELLLHQAAVTYQVSRSKILEKARRKKEELNVLQQHTCGSNPAPPYPSDDERSAADCNGPNAEGC